LAGSTYSAAAVLILSTVSDKEVTVMQEEQLHTRQNAAEGAEASSSPAPLPACCGTGCTVCVLDYPEYFSKQQSESEMLAMLEAIEQAQRLMAK
jgi:hypothetical protein